MDIVLRFIFIVKSYIAPAAMLVVLYLAINYARTFSQVTVPNAYREIRELSGRDAVRLNPLIGLPQLRPGDLIAFRLGGDGQRQEAFGYVAALPGDRVAIDDDGRLLVNDDPFTMGSPVNHTSARPAIIIPAEHIYVWTDMHQQDSLRLGPIPAQMLIGRERR